MPEVRHSVLGYLYVVCLRHTGSGVRVRDPHTEVVGLGLWNASGIVEFEQQLARRANTQVLHKLTYEDGYEDG